ncbi:MAG: hypothetical protein O7C75_08925 [Verrucomicrobia bacterium]|nr:hypothetical protein [Verrucomicrobiota bacterium]
MSATAIAFSHVTRACVFPPNNYIGSLQFTVRKSLFRIIQGNGSKFQVVSGRFQSRHDFISEEIVIRLLLSRLPFVLHQDSY